MPPGRRSQKVTTAPRRPGSRPADVGGPTTKGPRIGGGWHAQAHLEWFVVLRAAQRSGVPHVRRASHGSELSHVGRTKQKPIRYERVNAETGEEVPWKDIVKAFEYDKGSYVVIEKEDIAAAAPRRTSPSTWRPLSTPRASG